MTPSKYHAKRVKLDGITFDSQSEARRYGDLKLLEKAGAILELRVHPRYVIVNAWEKERPVYYVADFSYDEVRSSGPKSPTTCWYQRVVEDVKGFRTPLYKLKARLFRTLHPEIEFREIAAKDV